MLSSVNKNDNIDNKDNIDKCRKFDIELPLSANFDNYLPLSAIFNHYQPLSAIFDQNVENELCRYSIFAP